MIYYAEKRADGYAVIGKRWLRWLERTQWKVRELVSMYSLQAEPLMIGPKERDEPIVPTSGPVDVFI